MLRIQWIINFNSGLDIAEKRISELEDNKYPGRNNLKDEKHRKEH